jgi:carboxyl-terminal processing protease
VLPESDPTLGGELPLLKIERPALEAELGAPVDFVAEDPRSGARWLLVADDAHVGPATLEVDRDARLIVSRGRDVGGLFESMNLLRTAVRCGGPIAAVDCRDVDEAIERVVDEVADTYPSFELRGLDWEGICERHVDRVREAEGALAAFQRWLAELQDGHTWAWMPVGNLPYAIRVDAVPTFVRVPAGTVAHRKGVRPGWRLDAVDGAPVDARHWLERAAAPPHSRPLIAGRRLLAGPPERARELTASDPDGERVTWSETPTTIPSGDLVTWRRLGPGAGYLRIAAWIAGHGIEEAIDEAFGELAGCDRLVLDLRGNPGGNLVLAAGTRDRFLRERTTLGSIRYSMGAGELSPPCPIVGDPASDRSRWAGRLVVLTDPLTFSSSEDFLLGLSGLEHVTVVGQSTGGGSGRARALRLLAGMTLTVSTALTYDRLGRCIEGAGIGVDVEASGSDEEALALAEAL